MDEKHIDAMQVMLRSQLDDTWKARRLLACYWWNRIAFVWTTDDVHLASNERGRAITQQEARSILREFYKRQNWFTPVDWFRLLEVIDEFGLGRKLTKAELNRFLETNLIVVAKPSR